MKMIAKYQTDGTKRVVVITDNCRKQYRNRMNYGFVADFEYEFNIEMELLFEEQYHGKCVCDALCGLFKLMAKQNAYFKDSQIARKTVIHSHTALAEFGRSKFCAQGPGNQSRVIQKEKFQRSVLLIIMNSGS